MNFLITLLTTSLLLSPASWASDHIDGPITSEHGVSDIADFFAFPTPGKKGSLTLIMNSYPMAPSTAHFEERLRYVFRIRPLLFSNDQNLALSELEHKVTCQFYEPHSKTRNALKCQSNQGLFLKGRVNQVNKGDGIKVWAGLRSDPFFFNANWALKASSEGVLLPPKNSNIMEKLNVLSIVIELDANQVFSSEATSSQDYYALSSEIHVQNSPGTPLQRLDRVGRPEITNVSLVSHGNEKDLRDIYNTEDSFFVNDEYRAQYSQRLFKNISYFDQLDGRTDWSSDERLQVANLLIDDFLIVAPTKTCSSKNFLSIEKSFLNNQPISSCGGRFLHEDIMDELFSFYITKGQRSIRDGVDQPYKKTSSEFPYLAQPDTGFLAKTKAWLARKFAK